MSRMKSPSDAVAGVVDHIGAMRRKLAELRGSRAEVEAAPLDIETALANVDRLVEAAAVRVEPVVGRLASHDADGYRDTLNELREVGRSADPAQPRAVDLFAAAAPDLLGDWLKRLLRESYEGVPTTLTSAERRARLGKLDKEICQIEQDEAAALWALEDAGFNAPWTGRENPARVLGLE